MKDLDNKLMLILEDLIEYERDPQPMKVGERTFIEQIKQAFKDDGWLDMGSKPPKWEGPDSVYSVGLDLEPSNVNYDKPPEQLYGDPVDVAKLMTGQEWYDKFIDCVEQYNYDHRGGDEIYLSGDIIMCMKQIL